MQPSAHVVHPTQRAATPAAAPEVPAAPGIGWFLARAGRLLRPHRAASALIGLAILLHLGYSTFLALSFKLLVDYAIMPRDGQVALAIVGALALVFLVAAAADVGHDYLLAAVSAGVLADLRGSMFDQLGRMSMAFYAQTPGGALAGHFAGDAAAVELGLSRALPKFFGATVRVAVSIAIMVILDWRLTAVTLLAFPVVLLGPRLFGGRAGRASAERKDAEAGMLSVMQEQVAAQAVIKVFRLQGYARGISQASLDHLAGQSRRADFFGRLVGRVTDIGQTLVQVVIVTAGAWLTFYGYMSIGSLLAFFGMVFSMGNALFAIAEIIPDLIQAASGLSRIEAFLGQRPPIEDAPAAGELPPIGDAIVLDDVLFRYGDEGVSLDHVSCRIPVGQSVAFVGRSGSGKSTILNLIMRLYDPTLGAVSIDAHNLRHVSQDSLRAQMRAVFQDSLLLNMSVRENIRLGRPGASDAEVEAAAQAAEVHEAILRLPQHYDTVVGERGGRLSGGQRQRIALARALIGDPAILILDEATSALDPEAEAAINATLARLAVGRTVVAATHRLAAVRQADRIFVMDHGRIIEQGSHAELLALGGTYWQMWEQQHGFTLSEDGRQALVTAERLATIPLFAPLGQPFLAAIAEHFVTEQVAPGQVVFAEGDLGDRFYLVVRGMVDVFQYDQHGAERPISVLEDGDFFGEIALLRAVPRTAMVRARTGGVLLSLAREHFLSLVAAQPALRAELDAAAAHRQPVV